MTDSIFLRLDGIVGESTVAGFVGQIPLTSVSFGVTNAAGNGIAGAKAVANPFAVTKAPDIASVPLLLATCAGAHISTGTLSIVRSTQTQAYVTVDMTELSVLTAETSTTGQTPSEFVSFICREMIYTYLEPNTQGVMTVKNSGGWDFARNARA